MWDDMMNTVQAIAAIIIIAGGVLFTVFPFAAVFMPYFAFLISPSIMLGMLLCFIGFVILLASVIKERLEDMREEKL